MTVTLLRAGLTLAIGVGLATAQTGRAPAPVIDIVYPAPTGSIFDANCGAIVKSTVKPEAIQEAVRRAPELQAAWDREGPTYLATAFAEIGLPFPYKEMQATLTVCPGISTMSSPLFVNVTQFLPSAAERQPDDHFVEQLFHELMHNYVRQVRDVSALRKKYAGEPNTTLSHLHVIALERFVLTKLNRGEELKRVEHDYVTSKTPGYRRAWEIVNEAGVEPFLNELKQIARGRQ